MTDGDDKTQEKLPHEDDESAVCSEQHGTGTWLSSSFIMANIVIGAGMLNFPAAYSDAGGIVITLIVQSICVVFIVIGVLMICACADVTGSVTFQDTVDKLCGQVALVFCNICIIIEGYGSCVTLMVILADQIDGVLWLFVGVEYCEMWFLQRAVTLPVISILCILPNLFWSKMESFKIGSCIGVISTLYIVFLTIWKYSTKDQDDYSVYNISRASWIRILNVIPTVCFGFEGHIESVTVYAGLKNRSLREFRKTVILYNLMCVFVYSVTGVFGYLTFGDDVTSDILASYDADWWLFVALIITGIKSVTAYPTILYCVRIMLEEELMKSSCWRTVTCTDRCRRAVVSCSLFIISVILAVLIPNIGSIISLLGGSACAFIFILPGLCYIQVYKDSQGPVVYAKLGLSVLMVVMGVIITVYSTGHSINQFTDEDSTAGRPCAQR